MRQTGAVLEGVTMDSNTIEKERGITILAKNTAIGWRDWRSTSSTRPGTPTSARSRTRAIDGRRRAVARGCRGRPDAADAVRHEQGVPARLHPARRHQQDRPRRRADPGCSTRQVRAVRSSRRQRQAARFPRDLCLGPQGLCGHERRGSDGDISRCLDSDRQPRALAARRARKARCNFRCRASTTTLTSASWASGASAAAS